MSRPPPKTDRTAPVVAADGRERRGQATRAALIEAVIASVAKHGLEGTTISRVAEVSGQARGLIAFHFDSKDKLLEAALNRARDVYEESWQRVVMSSSHDAAKRIHAAIDHDIDFAEANPRLLSLWCAAWGEARASEIYLNSSAARDEGYVKDLQNIFKEAGLQRSSANEAATITNSFLLGCWLQFHISRESLDLEPFRKMGHRLIERLLSEIPGKR